MVRKRLLFGTLILITFILSTVGCSSIGNSHFWRPETGDLEIKIDSKHDPMFQHGNVDLTVQSFLPGYNTYFVGPPFIPIVPVFLLSPLYRKYKFHSGILIHINSSTDTSTVDFSRTQLRCSEGKRLQLRKVEEYISDGGSPPTIKTFEIQIGRSTVVNRRGTYHLEFEDIPYNAEELQLQLQLEFGDLEVNGNNVKVPVFKWRPIVTKCRYNPFYMQ